MPGTRHFSRMQYHVSRGLREVVAPRQTMPKVLWGHIKGEFGGRCAYCRQPATKENRGIVPDHLIPVTKFGELVVGNTVPACQDCNDTREADWRHFLRRRFPKHAESRIRHIECYLDRHPYRPPTLRAALSSDQRRAYLRLLADWRSLLKRAHRLRAAVARRSRYHHDRL